MWQRQCAEQVGHASTGGRRNPVALFTLSLSSVYVGDELWEALSRFGLYPVTGLVAPNIGRHRYATTRHVQGSLFALVRCGGSCIVLPTMLIKPQFEPPFALVAHVIEQTFHGYLA